MKSKVIVSLVRSAAERPTRTSEIAVNTFVARIQPAATERSSNKHISVASLGTRMTPLLLLVGTALLAAFVQAQNVPVRVHVWTQHNNNQRTGWMDQERTLTPDNVNSSAFGLLFTRPVDDKVYGQPLYIEGVNIPGIGLRKVVFVATAADTVYAFDAENPAATAPLWRASLLMPGEAPGSASDVGQSHRTVNRFLQPVCGSKIKPYTDMFGHIGVTGTPAIDLQTETLFVVSKSKAPVTIFGFSFERYFQRLHALDITTGRERPSFPVDIHASVPGSNEFGSTAIQFNAQTQNQRAALALWRPPEGGNAVVLIAWGSHGDAPPYHGWLMAFDGMTGENVGALVTTPHIREMDECGTEAGGGSIWQAGQGPSVDELGNIYVMTGNGSFDPGLRNFGSTILKITLDRARKELFVADYFTPANYSHLTYWDVDIGSAGALLSPESNLLIGGGKEGRLYTLDRSSLGMLQSKEGSNGFWAIGQHIGARHIHGSPVTWETSQNGWITYVWPENDWLRAFRIDHAGRYSGPPELAHSTVDTGCGPLAVECMPGGMLSISSNGHLEESGIIWASVPDKDNAVDKIVPGRLIAFRASPTKDEIQELWRSDMSPPYASAYHRVEVQSHDYDFSKFSAPTVANGRVYLSTFSNELRVYGLR